MMDKIGHENEAQTRTLDALGKIIDAARKRSVTIQFMPESPEDCCVEVIRVHDGEFVAVIDVTADGALAVQDG